MFKNYAEGLRGSRKGWLLEYKNPPDPPGRARLVYLYEEKAYGEAMIFIEQWVSRELNNISDENLRKEILEIYDLLDIGEHEKAYRIWREYANKMNPKDDILIEEIDVDDVKKF